MEALKEPLKLEGALITYNIKVKTPGEGVGRLLAL